MPMTRSLRMGELLPDQDPRVQTAEPACPDRRTMTVNASACVEGFETPQ
jgi:hypothetical protein